MDEAEPPSFGRGGVGVGPSLPLLSSKQRPPRSPGRGLSRVVAEEAVAVHHVLLQEVIIQFVE